MLFPLIKQKKSEKSCSSQEILFKFACDKNDSKLFYKWKLLVFTFLYICYVNALFVYVKYINSKFFRKHLLDMYFSCEDKTKIFKNKKTKIGLCKSEQQII